MGHDVILPLFGVYVQFWHIFSQLQITLKVGGGGEGVGKGSLPIGQV
jgi:hypothetical protein